MLYMKKIDENSEIREKIERLCRNAFPANERRPLAPLLSDRSGCGEAFAFFEEETFVGFACLLSVWDISHLIYFAVCDSLRGKGYGTAALSLLRDEKRGYRLIADIEEVREAANAVQRRRRRDFYLRAGYTESEVVYDWRGERYRILICGGTIDADEFEAFWREIERQNRVLAMY